MTLVQDDQAAPVDTSPHLDHVMDLDSHEWMPSHLWEEAFGQAGARVAELLGVGIAHAAENSLLRDDLVADVTDINADTVWNVKGVDAPSAFDLTRRPAVLDEMGIDRQLVFPGFALAGLVMAYHPEPHKYLHRFGLADENASLEGAALEQFKERMADDGRAVLAAQNRWAVELIQAIGGDRVRPVGIVPTHTLGDMIGTAEQLIEDGVRCIWVPGGAPPGGTSPGDRALDPFWTMAEETDTAVVLHVGLELSFLSSPNWGANVPEFATSIDSSLEFPVEPLRCATSLPYCADNFVSALVLAGVFERHPALRFGVMESAAFWVGALAEKLDIVANQFAGRLASTLSVPPSEYIARNIRVAPFPFEPVDKYLERFPELTDVYAYASDFPHREGGKGSKRVLYDKIAHLGEDVVEKFFVTNGSWLLPD